MANSPTSNSYCKSKKAPQERAGCMAGSQWIFGMRVGWHTIPVKLLSQLRLSFGPPCSSNSSMGLSRYKRNRFRLHVLDSVYCSYWANQSCRPPQYEQTIEGHKLGSVRMARPGRTTSDQQWRLNGLRVCVKKVPWICIDVGLLRR